MEQDAYPIEKFAEKTIVINRENYLNPKKLLIPEIFSKYLDKVVIPRGLILDRIEKLAEDILQDNNGKEVVFLVVLKGSLTFSGHLAEKISMLIKNKCYTFRYKFEYITISSYQNDKSTGEVLVKADEGVLEKLCGKNVIIVEDIFDSGRTLYTFNQMLREQYTPLSLKSVFLVQKMNKENLKYEVPIEYLGFLVPNDFLIGYGMDYNQEFRELEHLCVINDKGIDAFKTKQLYYLILNGIRNIK